MVQGFLLSNCDFSILDENPILLYIESNPNERCNIMGYFQNLQVELEDMQDEELSETPAPKPAADHVALQTLRKDLRVRQPRSFCGVGWSLIGLAVATGVTVLVVSL